MTEDRSDKLANEPNASGKASGGAISRREFARRAALASAAVAIAPPAIAELASRGGGIPPASPAPAAGALRPNGPDSGAAGAGDAGQAQQGPPMPKLTPEGQIEVDARVQTILSQYGGRFSEAQKADLRRLCILAQPPLDRLRAYAVENGDGTALYLKPLMEREKKPAAKPNAKPATAAPASAPRKP